MKRYIFERKNEPRVMIVDESFWEASKYFSDLFGEPKDFKMISESVPKVVCVCGFSFSPACWKGVNSPRILGDSQEKLEIRECPNCSSTRTLQVFLIGDPYDTGLAKGLRKEQRG